jgi:RIO kinase 1
MAAHRSDRPRPRRYDDEEWEPTPEPRRTVIPAERDDEPDEPPWSTYVDALQGPEPVPDWVITDARAVDHDLGTVKSGKEADVSLLERTLDVEGRPTQSCLLAVKRYRSREHRMFHRDAGYLEGRREKKSREGRAIANRTRYGMDLLAQRWSAAEFGALARLWSMGAPVPYPVQLIGSELMMEFVGDDDGVAAPRLAQERPSPRAASLLWDQLVDALTLMAEAGYAHGDLSAYNLLVHHGRLVMIDLPQVVDLVGNPQGLQYLHRDCENICGWFAARATPGVDVTQLFDHLVARLPGER